MAPKVMKKTKTVMKLAPKSKNGGGSFSWVLVWRVVVGSGGFSWGLVLFGECGVSWGEYIQGQVAGNIP